MAVTKRRDDTPRTAESSPRKPRHASLVTALQCANHGAAPAARTTRNFSKFPVMTAPDRLFDEKRPLEIADQGCFFAGGRYVETGGGRSMLGQMYVQYQVPAKRRHPYPLVMIHGGGQTAVNFLGTPDGRRGWADYFLANGFSVYVVDQPGRGRSGYYKGYGKSAHRNRDAISGRFSAPENRNE